MTAFQMQRQSRPRPSATYDLASLCVITVALPLLLLGEPHCWAEAGEHRVTGMGLGTVSVTSWGTWASHILPCRIAQRLPIARSFE